MSAHAQKAKRNQIAAVADELAIAGVHEWCVRDTTGRTSGHVLIEFEHDGQRHTITLSGSNRARAINGARSDVRRICGTMPRVAQPSVKQEKRRPCAAPRQREQALPYRRTRVGTYEANAMSATLRALRDGRP
jgi:hypothetical protein